MKAQEKMFYTPQEVAEMLGFKVSTIWNYIRTGRLKCVKASARCYRISKDQLNNFINNK